MVKSLIRKVLYATQVVICAAFLFGAVTSRAVWVPPDPGSQQSYYWIDGEGILHWADGSVMGGLPPEEGYHLTIQSCPTGTTGYQFYCMWGGGSAVCTPIYECY